MKKRTIVLFIALLFVICGAAVIYALLVSDTDSGLSGAGGEKAPDFLIYYSEGREVTMSDFEGQPVVMNFWASWCGPCKSEMEAFNNKYEEFGDEVAFVMVNLTDGMRETKKSAMEFINGEGYSFPVYFDKDMTASESYQAYSIPVTYFIDAEGNIIYNSIGAMSEYALGEGIKLIYNVE